MTPYCTLADVYPLVSSIGVLVDPVAAIIADPDADPPVLGAAAVAGTQLTATAAAALIMQVSTEIDGHLRARSYELPVTDTEALAFLVGLCASGSAARILRSLFPGAAGVSGDAGAASAHEKTYQDGLALIDRGGLDVDMVHSGTGISFDFDDYSDVETDSRKPTSGAPY